MLCAAMTDPGEKVPGRAEELRTVLAELATAASRGCGLVYELYQSRFDQAVEVWAARMGPEDGAALIAQAAGEFDYLPNGGNDIAPDDDTCQHGLDAMTCPCGCFESDTWPYEEPANEQMGKTEPSARG